MDIRIEIKAGSEHFTNAAYEKHAKLYIGNGAQFIFASQELFKHMEKRTAVYWYMKGMALELIFKGILYGSDKANFSPKILKERYRHNLVKLQNTCHGIVELTEREIKAIKALNNFYYDQHDHVLRYPSLLNVLTVLVPKDEHDDYITEALEKLLTYASREPAVKT